MSRISQQRFESYLWGAATLLRGTIDAGDYKQFIFPVLFYKRVCDVFDEETQAALKESGGDKAFAAYPENHRFQIPSEAHWRNVRQAAKNVGKTLHSAMRAIETANPDKLYGIFGDAQWTNKDRLSDAMLRDLVEHFSTLELTVSNLPEDELGQGYEYLIKQFADDSGHTAAEFYTNRTVVHLMTEMLKPRPNESIYDPTCGSGGMLLSCIASLRRQGQEWRNVRLYGQERNLITSSIARMNCFLHGIEDFQIVRGDTLSDPKFVQHDRLMCFDVVLANPPYSIKQWDRDAFAADPWGRNLFGTPPQGRADYAFWQHILCSLSSKTGRCAILFPHGVLFRQEEEEMRRKLIETDVVECVLGLGPNLFYNAAMEACVVICRTTKPKARRGRILFINAVNEVTRERSQSFLTDDHIERIVDAYGAFADRPCFAKAVELDEVRNNGHSLKIDLYISAPSPSNGNGIASEQKSGLRAVVNACSESQIQVRNALSSLVPDLKSAGHRSETLRLTALADIRGEFDRKQWTRVRFGDVVKFVKDSIDPSSGELDRYVAGEHMDTDAVHIRRWGMVGDGYLGPAFIRRFRKGQVLYGSRRTYLRKVAYAEFDGITANTTFVLEGVEGKLHQPLLPWLMLTHRFTEHSVRESKGSTNPYINFPDIAKFELDLPSLDQQRRMAEILWAIDECGTAAWVVAESIQRAFGPKFASLLSHGLRRSALQETEIGPLPSQWSLGHIRGLVTAKAHSLLAGPFGTIFKAKDFRKEGVRIIQLRHITETGFVWGENETYMDLGVYERVHKPYTVRAGDLLITKMGDPPGIACIYPNAEPLAMVTPDVIKATIDASQADVRFLKHLYNSPVVRTQVLRLIKGATRPRVSLNEFFRLTLPIPPLDEQAEIAAIADSFESGVSAAKSLSKAYSKLLSEFTEAAFWP